MTNRTTSITLVLLVLVYLYQVGSQPVEQPVSAQSIQASAQAQPIVYGVKSIVTLSMDVSADFYATGNVWCFQNAGCQHTGVDYSAPHGSAVYMPFDCVYLMTGHYDDPARMGDYLICHLLDGHEYYSGHLESVQPFAAGQIIAAGTLIGFTNVYDHTHIQLRDTAGNLVDFQAYYATR